MTSGPSKRTVNGARRLSPARPFWLALMLTGLLGGLLLLAVQPRFEPMRELAEPLPFVRYEPPLAMSADPAVRERISLYDNSPLFLPTPWNASQGEVRDTLPGAGESVFPAFGPRLLLPETAPSPEVYVNTVEAPRGEDLLLRPSSLVPMAIGEGKTVDRLSSLRLVVRPAGGAGPVPTSVDLPAALAQAFEAALVPPFRALLLVDPLAPGSHPLLLDSTGDPALDRQLLNLVEQGDLPRRLSPGSYWVVAGP